MMKKRLIEIAVKMLVAALTAFLTVKMLVAALTAFLTAITTTSCMGHGPITL